MRASILFLGFFIVNVLSAQIAPTDTLNRFKAIETPSFNNDPYRGAQIKKWYDYGSIMDQAYGASKLYISDYIFPDSALFEYTNGVGKSFYYKIASVIDPKAAAFKTYLDPDFSKHLPYFVDSVYIPFTYIRKTSNNVIDTLIIEVGSDSSAQTLARNAPDVLTNFGVSEVYFKHLKFNAKNDGTIGSMELPRKTTLTVLLNNNWSTEGAPNNLLTMALPLNLPRFRAGENVFVTVQFKPGFSYTYNDTINKMGNTFQTIMWEEQGNNTFPTFNPGEYNCSYFANYYNLDPNNGLMYEGFYSYYMTPIWPKNLPEHFGFGVNIRYDEAWLSASQINNQYNFNCYPNPAAEKTILKYSLEESTSVQIKLFNMEGKLILVKEEGLKAKGVNATEINLTNLTPGIYFYSLNGSSMQKLIVQ